MRLGDDDLAAVHEPLDDPARIGDAAALGGPQLYRRILLPAGGGGARVEQDRGRQEGPKPMPHPPIPPTVGPHTRPRARGRHPLPGAHRSSGARAAATACAAVSLLALAGDPAPARHSGLERSGTLGGDVGHAPVDTLHGPERDPPAATSIEGGRADRELEELGRDAARAERAARDRWPTAPSPGLFEAERSGFPDRRSLSGPAPVLGTAPERLRVERLLGTAETGFARGKRDRARFLAEQVRAGLAAAWFRLPADDPRVGAPEGRHRALRAGLGG